MVVSEVCVVMTEGVSEVEVETAASLLGCSGCVDDDDDGRSEDDDDAGEEVEDVRTAELDVGLQNGNEDHGNATQRRETDQHHTSLPTTRRRPKTGHERGEQEQGSCARGPVRAWGVGRRAWKRLMPADAGGGVQCRDAGRGATRSRATYVDVGVVLVLVEDDSVEVVDGTLDVELEVVDVLEEVVVELELEVVVKELDVEVDDYA